MIDIFRTYGRTLNLKLQVNITLKPKVTLLLLNTSVSLYALPKTL